MVKPTSEYNGDSGSVSTDTGLAFTPSAYLTAEVTDWLRFGFGFNTPFGLSISWPET